MSNLEHLIENAIVAIRSDKDINDFKSVVYNQVMLQNVTATAEEIWEMASYVIHTLCACCDEKIMHGGVWTDPEDDDGQVQWYCSHCGYAIKNIGFYPGLKYCPVCGIKMDGGSNER